MGVKVKQWKGAWWVFIHHKGKRKAKRCGSQKAAELVAMKIDAALKLGQLGVLDADRSPAPPPAPTFAQLAEEWLERHPLLRSVSRTTMENYRSFTRQHLIPFFGSTRVSKTTPEQIEAFIAEKRSPEGSVRFRGKPISEQSLRVGLIALRLILERAVKAKLLPANPAVGVARFRRVDEDHVDPFAAPELRAILESARERNPSFATFVRLWAQSGMRQGEVCALRNRAIDFQRGTAVVQHTWTRGRLGPTKTRRSRVISVLHPVTEDTPEWRPGATRESRRVLGELRALPVRSLDPDAFVFGVQRPWSQASVNQEWRKTLAGAKVRYRNPEQLRHTFASTLLSRNAPLLYVQQQGGWRSAAVLLRVYARWLPQALPDATYTQPLGGPDAEVPADIGIRALGGTSRSS
ncbi:MAG: tyrosine-type recombinase/integrase [Candidatus Methylomirabilia bacterium]